MEGWRGYPPPVLLIPQDHLWTDVAHLVKDSDKEVVLKLLSTRFMHCDPVTQRSMRYCLESTLSALLGGRRELLQYLCKSDTLGKFFPHGLVYKQVEGVDELKFVVEDFKSAGLPFAK